MKQLAILRDGVAMLLATVMLVSSASAQTSAPKGQSETIKVHGHWTIVVKNPDGSVASHREFENALFQGDGDVVLAAILSRTSSTGMWAIELDGPTAAKPCNNGTSGVQCEILEPNGNLISGEEAFENLTMQLAGTPEGSGHPKRYGKINQRWSNQSGFHIYRHMQCFRAAFVVRTLWKRYSQTNYAHAHAADDHCCQPEHQCHRNAELFLVTSETLVINQCGFPVSTSALLGTGRVTGVGEPVSTT